MNGAVELRKYTVSQRWKKSNLISGRSLNLDLVRHVEVIQTMLPGHFCDYIRSKEVEAYIKHCREAFLVANVHEIA